MLEDGQDLLYRNIFNKNARVISKSQKDNDTPFVDTQKRKTQCLFRYYLSFWLDLLSLIVRCNIVMDVLGAKRKNLDEERPKMTQTNGSLTIMNGKVKVTASMVYDFAF